MHENPAAVEPEFSFYIQLSLNFMQAEIIMFNAFSAEPDLRVSRQRRVLKQDQ
jgi:hypothetical protein